MSSSSGSYYSLKSTVLHSILIYYFLHAVSTLVHSIYLMDLLNLELDEKALGLLFFFSTAFIIFIKEDRYIQVMLLSSIGIVTLRSIYPFVSSSLKILLAGTLVGLALIYYPIYFLRSKQKSFQLHLGFGIAVILNILFRTVNSSWDLTDVGPYRFIPFIIGLLALYLILSVEENQVSSVNNSINSLSNLEIFGSSMGLFGVFALFYFAYASPAVFSRWSGLDYRIVITTTLIPLAIYLGYSIFMETNNISKNSIIIWNVIFFSSLIVTILTYQVDFLDSAADSPIFVSPLPWYNHLPLMFNLILSPVLLIDLSIFLNSLGQADNVKILASSFLLAEFFLVILIFMLIFSNVWGYVEPISPHFRGLFWLPFLLIGLQVIISLAISRINISPMRLSGGARLFFVILLGLLILSSIGAAIILSSSEPSEDPHSDRLRILTYNIQQGADIFGQVNYVDQLELIRNIDPDIIGLQESDIAKINTANHDIIRYFADQLGYYSYYGPKTVMQTYGVALLSRYPISDVLTFYTLGDEDEIGSIKALVTIGGVTYNVFVNHPAGSDESKLDHTEVMLDLADGLTNVILMGDFNWRQDTEFYKLVNQSYIDSWRSVWPTGIDDQGLNYSSSIDHIFVSSSLPVVDATYIPSPQSQTDHPALWIDISV